MSDPIKPAITKLEWARAEYREASRRHAIIADKLKVAAQEMVRARLEAERLEKEDIDPRDPDPTREGIFRDHNCWKCDSGRKPHVSGRPHTCEYPHARND